jgi:hypothetical protein
MSTLVAACGTNSFRSSGTPTAANLKSLNELATSKETVSVHFDRVDHVQVLNISTMPDCPPGAECGPRDTQTTTQVNSQTNSQTLYASITGPGSLVGATQGGPSARNLNLIVAFNPTITNGQACLVKAQNALIRALQLDIKGKVNLIPVANGTGSGNGGGKLPDDTPISSVDFARAEDGSPGTGTVSPNGTSIGQLVYEAKEVADDRVDQPIFIDLDVGVVFSGIESCTEGGPAVTPPPVPQPTPKPLPIPVPPPVFNRYSIHLEKVTAVSCPMAYPNSGVSQSELSRPHDMRPLASISGMGNFKGSKGLSQINIHLEDTPATAPCLSLARRLLYSGMVGSHGLDIEGRGWDLAVPMMACALNNCPTFINIHLNELISCKVSL